MTMPRNRDAQPGDPPSNPASWLWWAVPAIAIVLLAVIAMLFGGGPEQVDHGTSYDASPGGSRAAYLVLEELGYPVERSRRPAAGDEIRWLLFPSKMGKKEAAFLDRWVQRGGTILLAVDEPTLAERLGLPIEVFGSGGEESFPRFTAKGESYPAAAPDVSRLLAGETVVFGPPGDDTWGEIDGDPLITIHEHGEGQIWLLHRPDVLANANLRGDDNAILACRLADAMLARSPGSRLAFDEYCHGLRDRPNAMELLFRPPVLGVTLQVLLVAVLVLWHYGVRFGPIRPAPPPPRRSKEEFLDAMAELLTRNGDRAEAFRTVRNDLLRRLESELGLPAGTPVEQTVSEAAGRRGIDPEPLLRLLTSDEPPGGRSPAAFLEALNQLDAAAHECIRTRSWAR
jgi:hypothetical protein